MPGITLPSGAYVRAYIALLVLLGVNVGINCLNLGWGNMFIAVVIAALQGAILALVLMHGLYEKALVRLVMAGSILWFLILITLTLTDYITRNWLPVAGK
jgi:cytochrome c oxidase subunit 4